MDRFNINTKIRLEMNFSAYKNKPQSPSVTKIMPSPGIQQTDENRKNLMDETILKMLNSQSDQPLFETSLDNSNFADENQPPSQPEIISTRKFFFFNFVCL